MTTMKKYYSFSKKAHLWCIFLEKNLENQKKCCIFACYFNSDANETFFTHFAARSSRYSAPR